MPEKDSRDAEELVVTPADQWPTNEPKIMRLPSGAVAKLQRPQWYAIYRTTMPRSIRAIIDKRRRGEELSENEGLKIMDYSVCAAMVDPPGSLTRRKGAVFVPAMDEADKAAVLDFGGTP